MTDTNVLIHRFNQLRDSRNEAYYDGKPSEESWTETFGDEFESVHDQLRGRREEFIDSRSQATQCCCDDGNDFAIELWSDEFGDEYKLLDEWAEVNKEK